MISVLRLIRLVLEILATTKNVIIFVKLAIYKDIEGLHETIIFYEGYSRTM